MPKEQGTKKPSKTFKDYEPGFVHVDVKHLPQGPDESQRRYLFAAIDHRLIKPRHLQTNGMVERFNGRISEIPDTTRFDSAQSLEQTLTRYVRLYNHTMPQRALGSHHTRCGPEAMASKSLRNLYQECL
jgi:transposase InsO family protein